MIAKAVIAAGGLGTRLKTVHPKPFVLLNGKPLIAYCIDVFEKFPLIHGIIIVIHEYHILDVEDIVKHYNFRKVERVIIGGATRSASVYKGLQEVGDNTDIVVVHDGARPLLNPQVLKKALEECQSHGAAIAGVRVKPTIKRVDPHNLLVSETLSRNELWEIQTPQVFKRDVLLRAHGQENTQDATDDASLVERLGVPVKVVESDYENIKITTKEDLVLAEALLTSRTKSEIV